MNELELLGRLKPFLTPAGGELVIGGGEDDAACWRDRSGEYWVLTCDMAVEGVHFDLARQSPEEVGWRALALAMSDLAAKGAEPWLGLAALALPAGWSAQMVERLYLGLHRLGERTGLQLVGGDTSSTPSTGATLTLSLLGRTPHRPLARSTAKPGMAVAVTGPLGGGLSCPPRPLPRLEMGRTLAAAGVCCGDISDGLLREMDKFASCAPVGARLRADLIPLVPGTSLERALASGEEMELVCVGGRALLESISGLQLVGELTAPGEVLVLDAGGRPLTVGDRGYDHFS